MKLELAYFLKRIPEDFQHHFITAKSFPVEPGSFIQIPEGSQLNALVCNPAEEILSEPDIWKQETFPKAFLRNLSLWQNSVYPKCLVYSMCIASEEEEQIQRSRSGSRSRSD